VNIFRYDDEEFRYHDGRLILRGNNGTGKSRVLALQFPFLFDGEVASHRLEPDGDPAKRVEWNLLLGDRYQERTGYTWAEFGRIDPATRSAEYVTIGCGMAETAGLVDIVLTPKAGYVDAMVDWNDPLYRKIIEHLPEGAKAGDYITSLDVAARKGSQSSACCGQPQSNYNPAVGELVAIGAAIAANCEPCFKYHYSQARKHGVSNEDIAKSVAMAQAVKEAPAKAILNLAEKYLECRVTAQEAGAPPQGTCCGGAEKPKQRVFTPTTQNGGCGCGQ
jgi:AhpD family alkylhydroperoxidase